MLFRLRLSQLLQLFSFLVIRRHPPLTVCCLRRLCFSPWWRWSDVVDRRSWIFFTVAPPGNWRMIESLASPETLRRKCRPCCHFRHRFRSRFHSKPGRDVDAGVKFFRVCTLRRE
ncbi:hypothetical protein LINPERHAP1_LOCUS18320 [Linum perenne]